MKHISISSRLRPMLCVVLALAVLSAVADDFTKAERDFLRKVTDSYTTRQSMELNGKLQMDRLPVNPSLKIYMEKGRLLFISVRAPFVGEVGRLEIADNQLTAVDKMHRRYVREDLSQLFGGKLPMKIDDIQDLLLGRAFIIDYGTLSVNNQKLCSVYAEPDCWLLVPLVQPEGGSVRYGYTFDFDAVLQALYVTTVSQNYAALAEYRYQGKKTIMDIAVQLQNKTYEAQLQLDEPKRNPSKSLQPIEINSNWQRVDIRTFLKAF